MTMEAQIYSVVDSVTAALTSDESDHALYPLPGRVIGLYPGDSVAWDDCCPGQLSFRLVSLTPKFSKPGGRVTMNDCAVDWWDVVLEVQVLRCTPTVDSNAKIPKPKAIEDSGLQNVRDMETVLKAIRAEERVYSVGAWTPAGPNGGCAGGTWTFTFRADSD
jgi:hypothetical protein